MGRTPVVSEKEVIIYMEGEKFPRVHPDILHPEEHQSTVEADIALSGPFEEHFDLYAYANCVRNRPKQDKRTYLWIDRNKKLIITIACLLREGGMTQYRVSEMFAIDQMTLHNVLERHGGRNVFVKEFTDPSLLRSTDVKMTDEVERLIADIASRMASLTNNQQEDE